MTADYVLAWLCLFSLMLPTHMAIPVLKDRWTELKTGWINAEPKKAWQFLEARHLWVSVTLQVTCAPGKGCYCHCKLETFSPPPAFPSDPHSTDYSLVWSVSLAMNVKPVKCLPKVSTLSKKSLKTLQTFSWPSDFQMLLAIEKH